MPSRTPKQNQKQFGGAFDFASCLKRFSRAPTLDNGVWRSIKWPALNGRVEAGTLEGSLSTREREKTWIEMPGPGSFLVIWLPFWFPFDRLFCSQNEREEKFSPKFSDPFPIGLIAGKPINHGRSLSIQIKKLNRSDLIKSFFGRFSKCFKQWYSCSLCKRFKILN